MTVPRFVAPVVIERRRPFQRRKADTLELVAALFGVGFTVQQIAHAMSLTDRRVRQVIEFLRLGQSQFASTGEAMTWLAKEQPSLELRCRYFRIGKESDGANRETA